MEKSRDRTPEVRSFGLSSFSFCRKESSLKDDLFIDLIGNLVSGFI